MKPARRRVPALRALLTVPNAIALSIVFLCGITSWWFFTQSGVNVSTPNGFIQSIKNLGPSGILVYAGVLALAIIVSPIPSTPVTMAAGAVWGPSLASVFGILGIFLGSLVAYFIGRTLGRSTVRVLTGKVIHFSKHRGEIYLGGLVFVAHLLPFMPCDLISYGAGISGMSFPVFATANLLGIAPCIVLMTYLGSTFSANGAIVSGLIALFLATVFILPWGVKRYNWFGLRDTIRIE